MDLTPADDGFHSYGADPFWQESWYFDWSTDDGALSGFARQGYYPHLGEAWFWLYLFVGGRVVAVRDHGVPLGDRWGRAEHRGVGLWWDFRAQEPLQAWSLQAEAFGIEVGEPGELLAGELGQPVPVGLDLSFEALAPPYRWSMPASRPRSDDGTPSSRFEQFGSWAGEILLGESVLSLSAMGERDHSWGRRDWWSAPWVYTAFHAGPGLAAHAAAADIPGIEAADGYVWSDGALRPVARFSHETRYDDRRIPVEALYRYETEDGAVLQVSAQVEAVVPVAIEPRPGSTGETFFRRGPASFEVERVKGRGQVEYNHPRAGPFATGG
jgi:hypothetical protein